MNETVWSMIALGWIMGFGVGLLAGAWVYGRMQGQHLLGRKVTHPHKGVGETGADLFVKVRWENDWTQSYEPPESLAQWRGTEEE